VARAIGGTAVAVAVEFQVQLIQTRYISGCAGSFVSRAHPTIAPNIFSGSTTIASLPCLRLGERTVIRYYRQMTQHHGNAPSPISNLRRGTTGVRDEMHLTGGLRGHRAGSGWMIGPF